MPLAGFRRAPHRYLLSPSLAEKGPVPNWEQGLWLSKKWLAPLFRGVHSSLAPTARPGSYAEKPLLRKAFCGFAVHAPGGLLWSRRDNSPCAAKSDESLKGLRSSIRQRFLDKLSQALCAQPPPPRRRMAATEKGGRKSRPADLLKKGSALQIS